MELMTLLLLKRQRLRLTRDVLFLACADEERGGICGIDWLDAQPSGAVRRRVRDQRGRLRQHGDVRGKAPRLFLLGRREGAALAATGYPRRAGSRLGAARGQLPGPAGPRALQHPVWRRPITLLPEVRATLARLREAGFFDEEISEAALAPLAERNPSLAALLTDTVSTTETTPASRPTSSPQSPRRRWTAGCCPATSLRRSWNR